MKYFIISEKHLSAFSFAATANPLTNPDYVISAEKEIRSNLLSNELKKERVRYLKELLEYANKEQYSHFPIWELEEILEKLQGDP